MKLSVIILTTVLSFFAATTNAADGKVSPAVLNSFNSSFEKATEVKWTATTEYYKADFSYNGMYVSAFYDAAGTMIALTRNISPVQLPVRLQSSTKKHYAGYWVSDLFELSNENGTTYYMTLENADNVIVVKAAGSDDWAVYQKQSKS
ncbi:MAG: hypothetical protein ACM3VS_05885 [Candidatus Dadabacteria bacterium]